jgi:Fur family ferric uptake transcriptional regulator
MQETMLQALRREGHKLTPQRRAVIKALIASPCHLAPAQLHAAVLRERSDVGLVTVYRTLRILADLDMVCEISVDGRQPTYFLRRPREHHHHLVCSSCGQVVDFTSKDVEKLALRLARDTGFAIEGHVLEFTGRCPACQGAA